LKTASPFSTLSTALDKKSLKVNIASCKSILKDPRTLSNSKVILSPYKNIEITNLTKETFVKTLTAKLDLTKEFTPKRFSTPAAKVIMQPSVRRTPLEPKFFTFEDIKTDPIPEEPISLPEEPCVVVDEGDSGQRRCVIF
jgi:hypothetical protein